MCCWCWPHHWRNRWWLSDSSELELLVGCCLEWFSLQLLQLSHWWQGERWLASIYTASDCRDHACSLDSSRCNSHFTRNIISRYWSNLCTFRTNYQSTSSSSTRTSRHPGSLRNWAGASWSRPGSSDWTQKRCQSQCTLWGRCNLYPRSNSWRSRSWTRTSRMWQTDLPAWNPHTFR